MPTLSDTLASHFRFPVSRFALYLFAGAASFGTLSLLGSIRRSLESDRPHLLPSPRETILPQLSKEDIKNLPYPPDALPGARDIDSPYGRIRLYEWGPEGGPRVLLIHGISTPSIALGRLAHKLVENGCRVMLFDLFGRGYSSGPDTRTCHYDSALYASQILLCLQSSRIDWRPFMIIGYSLGGAIAADFTSYFPHLISNLILIAPGGLIRTKHITWKSKLLYSTGGVIPERLIEKLVAQRLWTGPETARTIEPEPDTVSKNEYEESRGGLRSHAVYQSSHHGLIPSNSNSTVGKVVDWQIQHHQGFVPAFISSIRYAPIHNQHHRWKMLRQHIEQASTPLKEVHLVLGQNDPIIIANEVTEDATAILGEQFTRIEVIEGAGHEVAIGNADEIAELAGNLLQP